MSSLLEQASLVITPNAYKAGKLYGLKGTDLDVVRATTATRVNESGLIESVANNVPRLDYTGGSCPSVLVEPQRTNLATYSEQFDNADWTKTNCSITANDVVAPNGTNTADKLIMSNGQSGSSSDGTGLRQLIDISSNSYTFSIFAKAGEFSTIRFRENQATGAFLTVNLLNGEITNEDSNQFINAKAELYSNGWYRITFQTPTLTAIYKYSVRVSETGNGTSGIYIWGFQVEAGSYATSYIPTVESAVTRNADVISKTGIADLIGQTEGTVFVDLTSNVDLADGARAISLSNGAFANRIIFSCSASGKIESYVINGGSIQFYNETDVDFNQHNKIALAYKANNIALYVNGVLKATDTSATIPTTSNFYLGSSEAVFTTIPNNQYKSAVLWKTRLSNTELATLTTI